VCHSAYMIRSLVLKRNAVLARGTRKIDLSILHNDGQPAQLGEADVDGDLEGDVIDAEFVELEPEAPIQAVVLVEPRPIPVPLVTPGRAARATHAYATQPVDRRPILVIA